MATLDYTGSSVAGAMPPNPFGAHAFLTHLYRRLTVSDIIAADTTYTTNSAITDGDILQCIHVAAGFAVVAVGCFIRVIVAGTTSLDGDWGLAGGTELGGAEALDSAADTVIPALPADTWGVTPKVFTSNDTIDLELKTAAAAAGDFEMFITGIQLILGS